MKAFDTDILTQILRGNSAYAQSLALIPVAEQAYLFFEQTLRDLRELTVLSYTPSAEAQYQEWGKQKVRGSTHDLRIAALCVAHSATLVTRNRRDFEHIPGLSVEFWE